MNSESNLLRKTSEEKVLRDPVHHYIHIQYQVIWEVLGAREFQRLRRIRQLGGDTMVYHTGDHSRFSHSLGVYEICRRMLVEVPSVASSLSEEDKVIGMLAAMLHDIGHGPCSHMFESITRLSHEAMGWRIILDPKSEVHQVLVKYDPQLPERIVGILSHQGKDPLLESIVSSQLDADRMDYLLRDAYYTGTQYGCFDLERILRTLRVHDGQLCIKHSGVRSVEDYIAARSQMYWQVYLHPDAFGYELLIDLFFARYEQIRQEAGLDHLEPLYGTLDAETFFGMDEAWLQYGFMLAMRHPDPILSDMARRLLNRDLFAWLENPSPAQQEQIEQQVADAGLDPAYYYYIRQPVFNQVRPYSESHSQAIQVLRRDGTLASLSSVSAIAKALEQVDDEPVTMLYYPKGLSLKDELPSS